MLDMHAITWVVDNLLAAPEGNPTVALSKIEVPKET